VAAVDGVGMDGQALPAVGEQDARARGYCQKLRRGIVGQMQAAYIPAGSTWLFSIPEHLVSFRNVIPTLEIYTQKCVGTVMTRFYIVDIF